LVIVEEEALLLRFMLISAETDTVLFETVAVGGMV
jgi:hypothetical protein